MLFFDFGQSFCALGFPFLKLSFSFFGFKESADVREHIVHDSLQDVFRHVTFSPFFSDKRT